MKLRVELGPPDRGSDLPSWVLVEWAGRVGHPSSYGLLSGANASRPRIAVSDEGPALFRESLAGRADTVVWGLPDEYKSNVLTVLQDQAQAALISRAAHGEIGSSPRVFGSLTRMVCLVLAGGLPTDDEETWRLFDRCWDER